MTNPRREGLAELGAKAEQALAAPVMDYGQAKSSLEIGTMHTGLTIRTGPPAFASAISTVRAHRAPTGNLFVIL